MIRGAFYTVGVRSRPFLRVRFQFPAFNDGFLEVPLLVDTGADRMVLAPLDASRLQRELGIDLKTLPAGQPSTGIGGQRETRTIQTALTLDTYVTPLTLAILDAPTRPPLPSLLGRDILSRFALFLEERTNSVLLLDPAEADRLRTHLPR